MALAEEEVATPPLNLMLVLGHQVSEDLQVLVVKEDSSEAVYLPVSEHSKVLRRIILDWAWEGVMAVLGARINKGAERLQGEDQLEEEIEVHTLSRSNLKEGEFKLIWCKEAVIRLNFLREEEVASNSRLNHKSMDKVGAFLANKILNIKCMEDGKIKDKSKPKILHPQAVLRWSTREAFLDH